MKKIFFILILTIIAVLFLINTPAKTQVLINPKGTTISNRFGTPKGFDKENYKKNSWQYYLQNLELLSGRGKILDYTGKPIRNQSDHIAIIKCDIGKKDLQQCADAIIRLRAEYLFKQRRFNEIAFKFTSGHTYKWTDHARGIRPVISGNKVVFKKTRKANNSYKNFRKYLDIVFMYAGTISLNRDMKKVNRKATFHIGDVIIVAGSPGHAVLIVDRVKNDKNEYLYLIAEGYTPAQSIHILDSGEAGISPWFKIEKTGSIDVKRYYFSKPNIRCF